MTAGTSRALDATCPLQEEEERHAHGPPASRGRGHHGEDQDHHRDHGHSHHHHDHHHAEDGHAEHGHDGDGHHDLQGTPTRRLAIALALTAGFMIVEAGVALWSGSLSLLAEEKLKRLKTAGFMAMLPGIESWFSLGNKAKTGRKQGLDKVDQVSEHVNLILRYIPYVQTNFVLGLDDDVGAEPFELTKQFLYRSAGAFPGYSLLSAFGEAAPLNLELQRAGRVLPFPFHFLNNNHAMNVQP